MKIPQNFHPGFLGGFVLRDLLAHFCSAGWGIDARYWPRAAFALMAASATSLLRPFEAFCLPRSAEGAGPTGPLFVLGLHRSGTTFLHRLLACDPGFCHATRLDCFHPHTFAFFRRLGFDLLLGKMAMGRRHMDDVLAGWLSPEEDVFALMVLGAFGTRLRAVFPRAWKDFSDVVDSKSYGRALEFFVRKLEMCNGRAVVLKSQVHMAHIPEILSIFPDARFVMIFRDPVSRCASLKAMHESPGRNWCALQDAPPVAHERALYFSERLLRRYFADRASVRGGRLVEIRYEDLLADRYAVLERVYAELRLQGWGDCRRAIEKCGLETRPRRACHPQPCDDEDLRRIVKTHAPIYDYDLYPMPEFPGIS